MKGINWDVFLDRLFSHAGATHCFGMGSGELEVVWTWPNGCPYNKTTDMVLTIRHKDTYHVLWTIIIGASGRVKIKQWYGTQLTVHLLTAIGVGWLAGRAAWVKQQNEGPRLCENYKCTTPGCIGVLLRKLSVTSDPNTWGCPHCRTTKEYWQIQAIQQAADERNRHGH